MSTLHSWIWAHFYLFGLPPCPPLHDLAMCLAPFIAQRMEKSRTLPFVAELPPDQDMVSHPLSPCLLCSIHCSCCGSTASILPQGQVQDPSSWAPLQGCPGTITVSWCAVLGPSPESLQTNSVPGCKGCHLPCTLRLLSC